MNGNLYVGAGLMSARRTYIKFKEENNASSRKESSK